MESRLFFQKVNVPMEKVLLAVGEQVGHDNLSFPSCINKAVLVFLKEERHVYQLVNRVFIRGVFVHMCP